MVPRLMFLLAPLAAAIAGCDYRTTATAPQHCNTAKPEVTCRASFHAVAADPTAFDGRKVRMEGYLGVSARFFVLSSSKELFDAGVTDETRVRIRGPMDLQQKIYDEHAYSWVAVTGTFRIRKKNGTTDDILIGELHPPMEVSALQYPVPRRKETFDEVALDLEDLN